VWKKRVSRIQDASPCPAKMGEGMKIQQNAEIYLILSPGPSCLHMTKMARRHQFHPGLISTQTRASIINLTVVIAMLLLTLSVILSIIFIKKQILEELS